MRCKRFAIFLFLFAAYAVLVAHCITPHVHKQQSVAHHHSVHEHDHHNAQHHDSQHHDSSDDQENDNVFINFQHEGYPEPQFLIGKTAHIQHQQATFSADMIAVFVTLTEQANLSAPDIPKPRSQDIFRSQSLSYFFPLKAPPAALPLA